MQGFVYVPLPDASNDSAAISLLRSFRLMAIPMLNSWAKQQNQGVAIDLCPHNGTAKHRSDFVLEKAGEFSIPIVVFWDQASSVRVDELRSLTDEIPGITLTVTHR